MELAPSTIRDIQPCVLSSYDDILRRAESRDTTTMQDVSRRFNGKGGLIDRSESEMIYHFAVHELMRFTGQTIQKGVEAKSACNEPISINECLQMHTSNPVISKEVIATLLHLLQLTGNAGVQFDDLAYLLAFYLQESLYGSSARFLVRNDEIWWESVTTR